MPIVNKSLDTPLQAADSLMELHEFARTASLSAVLTRAIQELGASGPMPTVKSDPYEALKDLPPSIRQPVTMLMRWVSQTNGEIRQALKNLTPTEKRTLIEGLPTLAVEESSVKFDFVNGPTKSRAELLALLAKVDVNRILVAGSQLAAAVERAGTLLRTTKDDLPATFSATVDDVKLVVSGRGNDVHPDGEALVTIDLGGDDVYLGRHAAGIGYSSIVLDLGGHDRIQAGDVSMGAGLLGVGIAKFSSAGSTFNGGSVCFGSGIAGVGALANERGDDLYSASTLAEGFAMFGAGVLLDNAGDDVYKAKLYAQGASRTQGVGWCIDRRGSDLYQAGGLILNSPLFADVHYSFSQGFSSGYREDTGGISGGLGMLTDFEGDDTYRGETYAQAASYWFSVGSLYDASGHDSYAGYHYVQSSAMHLCAAFLFDLKGDDLYSVAYGAAHAIGHDYGVAMLLDRAGNDVYAARDSTPGVGNANGLGIFIDAAGDDRYAGPPGRGNPSRGTGSLGIFCDLAGTDKYSDGLANGSAALTPTWGIAYDVESAPASTAAATTSAATRVPGSLARPSDAELAKLYARASQWAVGTAQEDAAKAISDLIAIGMPALEWMAENRLANADRLQMRAFEAVTRAIGADGRIYLVGRLLQAKGNEAKNLLSLATSVPIPEASAAIPGLLANPDLQRQAVRAAGELKSQESVPMLISLAGSKDEILALNAMIALGQIGSSESFSTARALLASPSFPIRDAAMAHIATFPDQAMTVAHALLAEREEFSLRQGIELLGRIGTPDSLAEAAKFLRDERVGLRLEALRALAGKCPASAREDFERLKQDISPEVRALAARLEASKK